MCSAGRSLWAETGSAKAASRSPDKAEKRPQENPSRELLFALRIEAIIASLPTRRWFLPSQDAATLSGAAAPGVAEEILSSSSITAATRSIAPELSFLLS